MPADREANQWSNQFWNIGNFGINLKKKKINDEEPMYINHLKTGI